MKNYLKKGMIMKNYLKKGMIMKKLLAAVLVSIFLMVQGCSPVREVRTVSPDGTLELAVEKGNDGLAYRLTVDGIEVMNYDDISITIDGVEYPGQAKIKDIKRTAIDNEVIPTVATVSTKIQEKCNDTLIGFDGAVALRVRVYDDGAAFRWESNIDKNVTVNAEELGFTFAKDYQTYYPKPSVREFFSHQECMFEHLKISETADKETVCVPVLVELDGDKNILMTDVNVSGYPGLWVKGSGELTLQSAFPHYPAQTQLNGDRSLKISKFSDFLAKTDGKRSYPWRAFVVTDDAGLLTSTMLYSLADECKLKDTSWIKPGKVSWDWWNAWNITDMEYKAGINQETYKNYIDFAAKNKLQYIILDEGWSIRGPDTLLTVVPQLNIAKLVEYGRERNVGVILWMTSVALERNFDKAFKQFDEWGIKGLKVDFMQRDDQVMMDFCEKVARTAAEHKLIVDFHGGSKPTGLQRTYPNVLTHESLLGLEQSKWSKNANPDMAVLLPFIRMVVGPMDYTPGAMDNYTDEKFVKAYKNPGSLGTRCHQLAMYVAYLSPLQMLADTPTKYRKNPECMPFLQAVPTTWDETVVLEAEIGNVVAIARRNGEKWFVGALTDWNGRELTLKLDFLGKGNYTLNYWADGPNAADEATDTTIGKSEVTAGSDLKIKLAPGGGYAAILEPVKDN
ncbi:MAG: glycoside hydrolase family 97 protein [Planctomycetes bacterium]|nr:glycoside hydrolase family 97 protein [Planctomycetota bacterium]